MDYFVFHYSYLKCSLCLEIAEVWPLDTLVLLPTLLFCIAGTDLTLLMSLIAAFTESFGIMETPLLLMSSDLFALRK